MQNVKTIVTLFSSKKDYSIISPTSPKETAIFIKTSKTRCEDCTYLLDEPALNMVGGVGPSCPSRRGNRCGKPKGRELLYKRAPVCGVQTPGLTSEASPRAPYTTYSIGTSFATGLRMPTARRCAWLWTCTWPR